MSRQEIERAELADVELVYRGQTEKAFRFEDDKGRTQWLPKSQIEVEPPHPNVGQVVTVTMPQWIAREQRLV